MQRWGVQIGGCRRMHRTRPTGWRAVNIKKRVMRSRKDGPRQEGKSVWVVGVLLGLSLWLNLEAPVFAQLNEHCTVSVLNTTAQVRASGRWRLPNVPANICRVRARAT